MQIFVTGVTGILGVDLAVAVQVNLPVDHVEAVELRVTCQCFGGVGTRDGAIVIQVDSAVDDAVARHRVGIEREGLPSRSRSGRRQRDRARIDDRYRLVDWCARAARD